MAQKLFVQHNFQNIPQLNFAIETLATEPAAGKTGRLFRLSEGTLCYDDGNVIRKMVDLTQAVKAHTHPISEITNLQTTLDGKAPTAHTHAIADITNLQTTLDGKAATSHVHAIADITNLSTTLSGKSDTTHTHSDATTTVSGFMNYNDKVKLNGIATGAQVNTVNSVFGRTGAVVAAASDYNASQVAFTPSGTISSTTVAAAFAELDGDIGGKANTSHTHVASNITDFNSSVDNRVIAYFTSVAGSDTQYDTLRELIDRLKLLDTSASGARGFTATVGDGTALYFDITHNLASRNLIIQVFDTTDSYAEVVINKRMTSTNVVRITSDGPVPATGSLFVVILALN